MLKENNIDGLLSKFIRVGMSNPRNLLSFWSSEQHGCYRGHQVTNLNRNHVSEKVEVQRARINYLRWHHRFCQVGAGSRCSETSVLSALLDQVYVDVIDHHPNVLPDYPVPGARGATLPFCHWSSAHVVGMGKVESWRDRLSSLSFVQKTRRDAIFIQ